MMSRYGGIGWPTLVTVMRGTDVKTAGAGQRGVRASVSSSTEVEDCTSIYPSLSGCLSKPLELRRRQW